VIRDVPAEPCVDDAGRTLRLEFIGRPVGERRHDIAERADEGVALADDLVDTRPFHLLLLSFCHDIRACIRTLALASKATNARPRLGIWSLLAKSCSKLLSIGV